MRALDLWIGRVAFRFNAPEAALRMPFYKLRYFARYIAEVEKHEAAEIRKLRES
jgi:hypothetical protein